MCSRENISVSVTWASCLHIWMIQWFVVFTHWAQGPVKRLTRKGCSVILEISETEQQWFDSNATDSVVHFCNIFTLREGKTEAGRKRLWVDVRVAPQGQDLIRYRCVAVTVQGSFMLPWCLKTDRWVFNGTTVADHMLPRLSLRDVR